MYIQVSTRQEKQKSERIAKFWRKDNFFVFLNFFQHCRLETSEPKKYCLLGKADASNEIPEKKSEEKYDSDFSEAGSA